MSPTTPTRTITTTTDIFIIIPFDIITTTNLSATHIVVLHPSLIIQVLCITLSPKHPKHSDSQTQNLYWQSHDDMHGFTWKAYLL